MTDEEGREDIPKLKVMSSSDAAKARANAISDEENAGEKTGPSEGQNEEKDYQSELPMPEAKAEEPVWYYQPKGNSEPRTSGGIEPSGSWSEPEPKTSGGIEPSSNYGPEPEAEPAISSSGTFEPSTGYHSETQDATAPVAEPKKKKEKKQKFSTGPSGSFSAAFKGMISFFTIKKEDVGQAEMDAMEKNFHFIPAIGAVYGLVLFIEMLILYLLNYFVNFPLGPVVGITVLATVLLGSKFLHFDGLVDFGDGIVASGDRDKHIAAMKDTRVGAGGIGLALVVTLMTLAIYSAANDWDDDLFFALFFIIPATEVLVKNAMVSAASTGTAGEGMAARQVSNANTDTMLKSTVVSAVILVIGIAITTVSIWAMNAVHTSYWNGDLMDWSLGFYAVSMFIASIVGALVSMGVGKMMSQFADNTFGATTGDTLGATNEIARPIVSATMLAFFLIFVTILMRV
ncbi:MAG: adenosylcobinamide-GDP ribazoletransferase [Methanomassiliicoccaceae archaeon]|nr:adenosylcobinamide-GDP ribazoletransferase [Methanomassiliicoccaceae archaeon]